MKIEYYNKYIIKYAIFFFILYENKISGFCEVPCYSIAKHSIAKHSIAKHSIAKHSIAKHSIAKHSKNKREKLRYK
jgi:hypothetical protein